MAQATTYRLKVYEGKKLKTVGKARTGAGLKSAFTRARGNNPDKDVIVVSPDGKKYKFGPEVKKLTGKE